MELEGMSFVPDNVVNTLNCDLYASNFTGHFTG